MDKGTTIKELLKFSHLELAELLYRANDAYNDLSKENELLKASEKAALQSQKDSFEESQKIVDMWEKKYDILLKKLQEKVEQDKQIAELKKENVWLEANCRTHAKNVVKILNLEDEVSRLQGKVKEAWEAGYDFGKGETLEGFQDQPNTALTFEEWSNENLIK